MDEAIVKDLATWRFPVTVRLSDKFELGLPRVFARSVKEAVAAVRSRPSTASAIVHEFIDVERSFELLIHDQGLVLEHVPGLWESENRADPDAIIFHGDGRVTGYRYLHPRVVRLGNTEKYKHEERSPVDEQSMPRWAARVAKTYARIEPYIRRVQLPVSMHFVEDGSGDWHFLNVRPGYLPSPLSERNELPHIVTSVEDLNSWNGSNPILLRVTTERGKEQNLNALAKRLAQIDVPIYINFGLLSHPAMVLLSQGVKLNPSYLAPFETDDRRYKRFELTMDLGDDPVRRILREDAVFSNDVVHVVRDREPIGENHLLVLCKPPAPSFADLRSADTVVHGVLNRWNAENTDGFFYERGRAAFCTSGFTDKRAHLHLLATATPSTDVAKTLAANVGARAFQTLDEVWREASGVDTEYLVFGSTRGPFYFYLPKEALSKRFMRNYLGGHTRAVSEGGYAARG